MITLSLCMIVKNEEAVLERCLLSVADLADEIIIVDTGSTDKTKQIALRYSDKVFDFEWCDDFSKARNFAFEKASMQFVMWLDADDVIQAHDLILLKKLKGTLPHDTGTVFVRYNVAFDNTGKPTFSYMRERILKNCPLAKFIEPVHEVIVPFGKIIYSEAAITHKKPPEKNAYSKKTSRNLAIYQKAIKNKQPLSPRAMYYYARELMYHKRYKKAITAFYSFLKQSEAWLENKVDAHICIAQCFNALSKPNQAARILLESMELDAPRANCCCMLGQYFYSIGNLSAAKFWYESALRCVPNKDFIGFVERDYYEFLPSIWLCVIYDKLGDKTTAKKYSRLAAQYKPTDPSVIQNTKYFED